MDDAGCAVRSALLEGILPGGGLALYDFKNELKKKQNKKGISVSEKIACAILECAIQAPLRQILDNGGLDVDTIYSGKQKYGHGYDVTGDKYGDMIKMGIIDPMKVTKTALQNAVSVAITILSTNAIVTMARTYDSK